MKTRRGTGFGDPVEAVHWRKRRELVRSAHCWISRFGRPGEVYRFDVVGVLIGASDPLAPLGSSSEETRVRVRVRHVADAFGVPCSA